MKKRAIAFLGAVFLVVTILSGLNFAIDFPTSRGIKLHVIPDKDALYVHAEILIKYSESPNIAIGYLTNLNLFSERVVGSKSSLLSLLFRMGNDAKISFEIDHIKVKINFLKERIQTFIQFLKKLLESGNFSLKNYRFSVENFRDFFFSDNNWEKIVATNIARYEVFNDKVPSMEFIIKKNALKNINLSQVRSFYKKNFIPSNVTVAIKGNVNPYIFLGLVEKAFKNYKKKSFNSQFLERRTFSRERKTVILNTGLKKRSPEIFWFIPVPPADSDSFSVFKISNNILFGYPFGTVFRIASKSGVKILSLSTEVCDLQNISFICNRIRLSSYRDLEKFIFIASNSFRKLLPGRIGKKEYLSSYNLVYQSEKLASDKFEYLVDKYIKSDLVRLNPLMKDESEEKRVRSDLSFVSFSEYIENNDDEGSFYKRMRRGVIVIFGDSNTILKNIKVRKAGIVNIY